MLTGKPEFILVPVQNIANGTAVGRVFLFIGVQPAINTELSGIGFITDVARLYDDHVLAMVRVRTVSIGSDDAADTAMIEWKAAEVFGNQDNRITLVFI